MLTCDQAVFLPFFLLHSLQTTPDPRFLEVGLSSLSKRRNYFFSLNILFTLPRLAYPGYRRFYARAAEIFGVGRRPTHLRAGHYKALTETGNRKPR